MITILFNGVHELIESIEEFGEALNRFDGFQSFELWMLVKNGPSICMLRNDQNAWLMYLRYEGDSGFTSQGQPDLTGFVTYELENGQVDEYPRSWCIDIEQCYKVLAYFFANHGAQPDWISWRLG